MLELEPGKSFMQTGNSTALRILTYTAVVGSKDYAVCRIMGLRGVLTS
jgi:hypothetical protein